MKETRVYRLPSEYSSRSDVSPHVDAPSDVIHQPHVYELAIRIAERSSASRIIDVGCGNCAKLATVDHKFELIGIDAPHARVLARSHCPNLEFYETDLENGLDDFAPSLFDESVVICSDVLEHLARPERLASDLARVESRTIAMLLSTPDRSRARGLGDNGPPANASHVREWTAEEFVRFLLDCGLARPQLTGYTVNHDLAECKITTLVVTGNHARYVQPISLVTVAAIINTYNEEDMITEVLEHLSGQGVEAHVFDNWSTDRTYEELMSAASRGLCKAVARFPDRPSSHYEWARQLDNTDEYARQLDAQWILHYDADEIRCSPWPDISLRDAISFVDGLGYNAIDFTVLNFRFTAKTSGLKGSYEKGLLRFEFGTKPGHFLQIKGWKNHHVSVELAKAGGHEVVFSGRKVFPLNFLNKHYPLRSREQAARKVFRDRLPRFEKERSTLGWHGQYDEFTGLEEIEGWPERQLLGWHEPHFRSEYLVERLSGIGVHPPE